MPDTALLVSILFLIASPAKAAGCGELSGTGPAPTELLHEFRKTCAELDTKLGAAKAHFSATQADDHGHCSDLPALAAAVKSAEDTLKPALGNLRQFLRLAPRRYAAESGAQVYQALWAQRRVSCEFLRELRNAELVFRGRYSACNPAVGGTPYDGGRAFCFAPVDQGSYDPALYAAGSEARAPAAAPASAPEFWPNPDDAGGPVACAFAPGEEFQELCGPL